MAGALLPSVGERTEPAAPLLCAWPSPSESRAGRTRGQPWLCYVMHSARRVFQTASFTLAPCHPDCLLNPEVASVHLLPDLEMSNSRRHLGRTLLPSRGLSGTAQLAWLWGYLTEVTLPGPHSDSGRALAEAGQICHSMVTQCCTIDAALAKSCFLPPVASRYL